MDLAQLTDQPTLVEVAGRSFAFSELSLLAQGRLQAWIKNNTKRPLDALKPDLVGLPVEVQIELADRARQESLLWPPEIGTASAARALLASKAGQLAVLHEGLLVHHPEATKDDAFALYKAIKNDQAASTKILRLIFGTDEPEKDDGVEGEPGPKAEGASPSPSATT